MIASEGFNLIGDKGTTNFNQPTDQTGTAASRLDPRLAVTLDADVPRTDSYRAAAARRSIQEPAPAALGSPNHRPNAACHARLDDPAVSNAADGTDIGAFEQQLICSAISFIVNTTSDADDLNPGDGICDTDAATPGAQM